MLPFYSDATMWGPQGDPNQERPRLKPGDRMTDGRIFMGDNPEAALLAELARIEDALRPLEAKRNELLARLHEVNPEKYNASYATRVGDDQVIPGVEGETAPTPAKAKAKRG